MSAEEMFEKLNDENKEIIRQLIATLIAYQ